MMTSFQNIPSTNSHLLLPLAPFRKVINAPIELFGEYIKILQKYPDFTHVNYTDYEQLFKQLQQAGVLQAIPAFSNTNLLQINPLFHRFLGRQFQQSSSKLQAQIIAAYITYYDWYADQLDSMFKYTQQQNTVNDLIFIAWELDNLINSTHLNIYQHNDFDLFTLPYSVLHDYW